MGGRGRRVLVALVAAAIGAATLTGCHGGVHAEAVITGLEAPTSFTVDPSGEAIWYAERSSGQIRRRSLATNGDTLVATIPDVLSSGESGLFGLALHPAYPATQLLYAFATRSTGFGPVNQVIRITLEGGVGVAQRSVFNDAQTPTDGHVGGRILFGPDGMLYISLGEHRVPGNAQNLNVKPGKVHRITPTGAVPADNPFPRSTIWAFGLRNSFGFDFDTANGQLWLTDNGPSCNDEVHRIVKGANHSWGPEATCATPPPAPGNTNRSGPETRRQPEHFYVDTTGITGAAFCGGCGLGPEAEDDLFVTGVNDGQIHQLALNQGRTDVASDDVVYDHPGGLLSMETRPGEPVYFSDFSAIYKLTLAD